MRYNTQSMGTCQFYVYTLHYKVEAKSVSFFVLLSVEIYAFVGFEMS